MSMVVARQCRRRRRRRRLVVVAAGTLPEYVKYQSIRVVTACNARCGLRLFDGWTSKLKLKQTKNMSNL